MSCQTFTLLNYLTDQIVRVALTTLARNLCFRVCVCKGENVIKCNFVAKHRNDLSFLSYCLLYSFVWPESLWVLVIAVVRPLK